MVAKSSGREREDMKGQKKKEIPDAKGFLSLDSVIKSASLSALMKHEREFVLCSCQNLSSLFADHTLKSYQYLFFFLIFYLFNFFFPRHLAPSVLCLHCSV